MGGNHVPYPIDNWNGKHREISETSPTDAMMLILTMEAFGDVSDPSDRCSLLYHGACLSRLLMAAANEESKLPALRDGTTFMTIFPSQFLRNGMRSTLPYEIWPIKRG